MKKLLTFLLFCPLAAMAEPVNINTADADTIARALNGVGPKKAEVIVQYRQKNGDFKSLADLQKVTGIGEKTIQANEKDILFSDATVQGAANGSKSEEKSVKPAAK